MNEKHYKEKLSSFVNHELPDGERQAVGEHLLLCADCRAEHDQIKLGAALAQNLNQTDAPANLWNKIENALHEKEKRVFSMGAFFGARAAVAMTGLLLVCGLTAAIYFGFLRNDGPEIAAVEPPAKIEMPPVVTTPSEISANQNSNKAIAGDSNVQIADSNRLVQPQIKNSNVKVSPKNDSMQPRETTVAQNKQPAWTVETLTGTPKIGSSLAGEKLAVGQILETDAGSRARVRVANIGQVEIAPNSRIQLVKTNSTEHRLSLERGVLEAQILAPPRLFIVDTPSAVAVDLGCAYTLEVADNGDSKLHVTSGFVALERDGRESIVPAGAMALTKKNVGLGTPFAEDAAPDFRAALYKFDFENGGSESLQTILKTSDVKTSLTLWHLLSRVSEDEREKVFSKLISVVKLPDGASKAGILKLDKEMLEAWRAAVEEKWFENFYK